MKTPVAFFIFKRPDCTRRVWEAIRQARPPILLLVADGPRDQRDHKACEMTRMIVEQVDWPCDVRRNYADVNMGCRDRMATGLNWVFSEVEEAIILEDDCVPAQSFFFFCDELLERYRFDARVMCVSGSNFQRGKSCGPWSYYFSKYPHCWGWASWRRAWKYFDLQVRTWPDVKAVGLLKSVCPGYWERWVWSNAFDRQYRGASRSWAYSWTYTCWVQHGLTVLPAVNLVSNIGTGLDSTHPQDDKWFMNQSIGAVAALDHPLVMIQDIEADARTHNAFFKPPFKVILFEALLNPWMYSAQLRKVPILGLYWIRFCKLIKTFSQNARHQ
jgi:hypothetical protein